MKIKGKFCRQTCIYEHDHEQKRGILAIMLDKISNKCIRIELRQESSFFSLVIYLNELRSHGQRLERERVETPLKYYKGKQEGLIKYYSLQKYEKGYVIHTLERKSPFFSHAMALCNLHCQFTHNGIKAETIMAILSKYGYFEPFPVVLAFFFL